MAYGMPNAASPAMSVLRRENGIARRRRGCRVSPGRGGGTSRSHMTVAAKESAKASAKGRLSV